MNAPRAEARYFGPAEQPLFGWLHRSADSGEVGLAMVVCNPFGFEAVCMHRSLRQIAIAAAGVGVPTLRFDYAACGHSAGDDADDGDLLPRWVASVHGAIDAAKQATGAARVVLFGVRLGAALAAMAAVERDDVHGLILVAPVVRGRAYLRELRLLGGAATAAPADARRGLESAGFVLSQVTCDAVSRLDLKALTRAPASRVVVVERDDLQDPGDLTTAWQSLGAQAVTQRWPGYAAMADDPQRAAVPRHIVDGVLSTLRDWQIDAPRVPARAAAWGAESMQDPQAGAWTECTLHIEAGEGGALFGVMCRPAAARWPHEGPAVLMLNAGSVHAIGPNRLWVRLARRWAARGMRVLRVDITGIGDSAARPDAIDNVVYSPHAMRDVAAALTHLRAREGATACHVMGLCSGAYHAFKAATTGLEVDSALMINPLTYFWAPGTPLTDIKDYEVISLGSRYGALLLTSDPWRRLVRGELDLRVIGAVAWRALARGVSLPLRALARGLHLPLKNDLARELRRAAEAGIPLRFVFAANAPGHALLAQQSGGALSVALRRGEVSVTFVADADHTFTAAEARDRLVGLLDGLAVQAFGLT